MKNSQTINALESALRSLTYILPDAEFVSEALYACLNLTGMYHDVIIRKKKDLEKSGLITGKFNTTSLTGSSPFNRYTSHMLKKDGIYKSIAYLLMIMQYTEVFVELLVQKKLGIDAKYNFICAIETLKALLKIILLAKTKNRMILSTFVPERDTRYVEQENIATVTESTTAHELEKIKFSDVSEYLVQKALVSSKRNPENLLAPLDGEYLFSEYVYIFRPLVYAILLYVFHHRNKVSVKNTSWFPWLTSIGLDLAARVTERGVITEIILGSKKRSFTDLEKDERRRRAFLLLYYLLRPPFYRIYTKPRIESFCANVGRIPVLSIFGNIVKEYVPLWDKIYFYTSAS